MAMVAFEDITEQKIIAWGFSGLSSDDFEFIGVADYSKKNWYDYYYSFPDFMREGWSEPTYVPPVDKSVQMPEVESDDIPAEDVN